MKKYCSFYFTCEKRLNYEKNLPTKSWHEKCSGILFGDYAIKTSENEYLCKRCNKTLIFYNEFEFLMRKGLKKTKKPVDSVYMQGGIWKK